MFSRIQSPSSINTFRQCPRKYYYQYIAGLSTSPSIHLVRGKLVHSCLERFFKLDISHISKESYDFDFKIILHDLIHQLWGESHDELSGLGLSDDTVHGYLTESTEMLQYWLIEYLRQLRTELSRADLATAFRRLTPLTEVHMLSERHGLQGFADAIFTQDDVIKIIDYKTNARDILTESHRLQLAIYALLYHETYQRMPDFVGIHFLRFSEKSIPVTRDLVDWAKKECSAVHDHTISEKINDYPQKKSQLCRWSSGQCDFYKECQKK
jgi:ATP-dependent helicase/DNAse subunit B